ncbi:transposase [Desulfobacterales bacterium HSG2]|nr:transposase [Desulfobacterales bacterium HSG2]
MIRGRIPRKASETCPGFRVKPDLFSCDSWSETQKPADRHRDETESEDKEFYMFRTHSPEEMADILKAHFIKGKPIKEVCEENRIHPETFRKWHKFLFEHGELAFIVEEEKLKIVREMVMVALEESVGAVPGYLVDEVMSVSRLDVLKGLLRQTFRCREIGEFEKMLKQATRQPAE